MDLHISVLVPESKSGLQHQIERETAGWARAADLAELTIARTEIVLWRDRDDWYAMVSVAYSPIPESLTT